MKHPYLILILLLISCLVSSQDINPKNVYSLSDYSFLKNIVKDKRVILLGEQTHGDGAVFDEKVRLIKYLHENMGYNTIVFESGLYDNYKASQLYKLEGVNSYSKGVMDIWSGTKAFETLTEYLDQRAAAGDTINIRGFDSQEDALFENFFLNDLKALLENRKLPFDDSLLKNIEKSFVTRDLEIYAKQRTDSLKLYKDFNTLLQQLGGIKVKSLHEKILYQVVISKIADVTYEIQAIQEQKIALQNPRDKQMANNMAFLMEVFPEEKFICWGASYHFSQNINSVKLTDITQNYIDKQIILEQKIIGHAESRSSEISSLKEAITMGDLLKQQYNNHVFSIAFSSAEGNYLGAHEKVFPILSPPENSIEHKLNNKNSGYIDWRNISNSFYCSALGNIPLYTHWQEVFDGLIFIKKSYPPELRKYSDKKNKKTLSSLGLFSGTVYDAETNEPIPYADILLTKTNKSVLSNTKGEFFISLPLTNKETKLIISAFGYTTDTIMANATNKIIKLTPYIAQNIQLNEVIINNKIQLTAEDIVKRARKNVTNNYFQQPYNQKIFFRIQNQKNGKVTFNEEAVINTYNKKGLSGFNNPANNFYAEIEQLRNTTGNQGKDKWSGVGHLWTLLYRDLILSKANVLYRTSSYQLREEESTNYNGHEVYKISFVNESPGTYSTGYGYPAPIQSKGILYIDKESFAVLKYEHCVIRESRINKRRPDILYKNSHNIITTYKKVKDRYFLNYCKEVTEENVYNTGDNTQISQNYYTSELMSVDINTVNPSEIIRPIQKIKEGYNKPYNQSYWETVSFAVDGGIQFTACEININ